MTVPSDAAIDRFTHEATPWGHHLALVNPIVAEQSGSLESDVLSSKFGFPSLSTEREAPEFRLRRKLMMHKNMDPNLVAAEIYAFGSQNFTLPAQQQKSIASDCAFDKDIGICASTR